MKIKNTEIQQPLILAPMESITDLPFRILCKRMGADLVYTEFIASEALIRDVKRSIDKMKYLDEERPIVVQIFGSNVESMKKSAQIVENSGADILDINFGCWVKRVVNNDAGAAFLKHPDKMAQMAYEVVNSVSIPVTAKTRLGWDKNSIVILETAPMLEQAGIQALAVHCRTREMAMKGQADWSWIPKIKSKLNTMPVILNGDIKTPEDVKRAFDETACDGVMIGRAAVGNPFLFKRAKEYLRTGVLPNETTVEDRIETCIEHLKLMIEFKGNIRGIKEFRKHYTGYFKGMYRGANLRQKLVLSDDHNQIENSCYEFKNSYHQLD